MIVVKINMKKLVKFELVSDLNYILIENIFCIIFTLIKILYIILCYILYYININLL